MMTLRDEVGEALRNAKQYQRADYRTERYLEVRRAFRSRAAEDRLEHMRVQRLLEEHCPSWPGNVLLEALPSPSHS